MTSPPPVRAKPFILVVDDDAGMRENLRELLESEGYGVFEASDGAQALRLIARLGPPGVLLLDLAMPGMSGHGFLAAVRARPEALAAAPVIVLTGAAGPFDTAPPVVGVLGKPFSVPALHALVA